MILSKNINTPELPSSGTPESTPVFHIGEQVHHITGGGGSFRLATVIHNKGIKIGIRLQDGKEMRVYPWSLRRSEAKKLRSSEAPLRKAGAP